MLERTLIRRIYRLDILYGLLLTFGLAQVLQGGFTNYFGVSGVSYNAPDLPVGRRQSRLHVSAGLSRLRHFRGDRHLRRHLADH